MADSIVVILLFQEMSDSEYQQCHLPFKIKQETTEDGEIHALYYEWETIVSPLTGAKCKARALSADVNRAGRIAGYELNVNVPASIIGNNYLLVNGVPRAVECAVELFRHHAARRGCSPYGLNQIRQARKRLVSVTPTFLFPYQTPAQALAQLKELRNHAEGILNHEQRPLSLRDKSGRPACFCAGSDSEFTLYIKQRDFKVDAYIKRAHVEGAFATFPSADVERQLVEIGQRTLRVEVQVHQKWLIANQLDDPESWRGNPSAYEKVFNLARSTLRLDEGLRVRLPTEAVIAKLPVDHQTVLRAHLAGENIREHPLVLGRHAADGSAINTQNKRFSALKRSILEGTAIDILIPWEIQSTKLSPHLKGWFKCPKELVPRDELKNRIFSRTSADPALDALKAMVDALMLDAIAPDEDDLAEPCAVYDELG